VAFSPDGTRLVSANGDQTARVWDLDSGQHLYILKGHADEVTDVAFSPVGMQLVSASWDGTVKLWDARPLSETIRVEREALGLLNHLFASGLPKHEVVARVRASRTISEVVRQQALLLAERYRADSPRPSPSSRKS
jgi:WD40 repeat protein